MAKKRKKNNAKKINKNNAKKIIRCAKKYKVDPFKDSHKTKMGKLRKFNKCRKSKKK